MAGLAASFGSGAMTNSISDLEKADTIFIIGSNTGTSHPLVATRIFRAKAKGAKILVADPRKNQIADFAKIYVSHQPGSDVALLNAMMKVILDKGLEDKEFIRKNSGFEEVSWDTALDYAASRLKEITKEKGADSIGFFASAKVTNEENYLMQKFARAGIGTNNIDHCARL